MKCFDSYSRIAGLVVLLMLAIPGAAGAEQLYVIDKLLLNVYAEPGPGSSGRVATIHTGDSVESLGEQDGYINVRLPDGREGWVKDNYVSTEVPAILRLKALQSGQPAVPQVDVSKYTGEIALLKKQNNALRHEVAKLHQKSAELTARAEISAASAVPLRTQQVEAKDALKQRTPASWIAIWLWPVLVAIAGSIGFALGYQALASRIRRKYGSVRIY